MRDAQRALAWEIVRRHRWGFAAIGAYLLSLGMLRLMAAAHATPSPAAFGFTAVVPLTAAMLYCVVVFSLASTGDIGTRASLYPVRLFTMPVDTTTLIAVPMSAGAASVALIWTIFRALVVAPSDMHIPLAWPALLAIAFLTWTQVFAWIGYPARGLRIVACVSWLVAVDTGALLALMPSVSPTLVSLALLPAGPVAFLVARRAVMRARAGDDSSASGRELALSRRTTMRPFGSSAAAQRWLEWRSYGRSLPTWMAVLAPAELSLLFVVGDTPSLVAFVIGLVLVTPLCMATVIAPSVRRTTRHASLLGEGSTFVDTRPLADVSLVAAKLRTCATSTAVAWAVTLAWLPVGVAVTGCWPLVSVHASRIAQSLGIARTLVFGVGTVAALALATWKQLVQGLYVALSPREWLSRVSVFATLACIFSLGLVLEWMTDNAEVQRLLWDALPFVLAALAVLKLAAASRVATRLGRSGLLNDRQLLAAVACWCAVTMIAYGALAWFIGTPLFPRYVLMALAVLGVPFLRLAHAPRALAARRHG